MNDNALDYRQHYGYQSPFAQNPLTAGQWVMIGAGAVAFGGLGYWLWAKFVASKTT